MTHNQKHILTTLELVISTINGYQDINDPSIDVYILDELDLLYKQGCFPANEIDVYYINFTTILNQIRKNAK